MYLKSCCTLLLLALVACQAAPSPRLEKKSINEAETTFGTNNLKPENTGAEKDRPKKSTTTFCVEVHSGKEQVVPCSSKQELPVVNVLQPQKVSQMVVQPAAMLPQPQSMLVPNPGVGPAVQPIQIIPVQPQPQSQSNIVIRPVQPEPAVQPIQIVPVQPQLQPQPNMVIRPVQPEPDVQPIQIVPVQSQLQPHSNMVIRPVHPEPVRVPPMTNPVINIVPSSQPCDHSLVPQELIHVVPQQSLRPQPVREEIKLIKPRPIMRPIQPVETVVPVVSPPCTGPKSQVLVVPPSHPVDWVWPSEQLRPASVVDLQKPIQEETYECNCGHEHNIDLQSVRVPPLHMLQSRVNSDVHRRISMMAAQPSEGGSPITHASQGEIEGRHHKHQPPVHLSVQFPIVYGSGNVPYKNYESNLYYPQTYIPSTSHSYGSYGTYGSYPTANYDIYPGGNYDSHSYGSASSIIVNAGGPFYKSERSNARNSLTSADKPKHASEVTDLSSNKKREVDPIQSKNDEQDKTIEKQPAEKEGTVKDIIPETDKIESTK